MSSELFAKLLVDFGGAVGIPSLAADEDGYCVIRLDERIVLVMQYEPDTESVVLYVDLGPYPPENNSALLLELLKANCLWAGTGGATLGVNADAGTILLCYRLPVQHFELGPFQSAIESVVNTAEYWKRRIEEHGRGEPTALPGDQSPTNLRV